MKIPRIALALAATLAIGAVRAAPPPEVMAERAAIEAAKAEYVAARDKAKVDYSATAKSCGKLAVENRAACIAQAKALRKQSITAARASYDESVSKAKAKRA